MKTLSVAVPCYNSAAYMSHCIDTLLAGGEDVEILIVNDGSTKDNTLEIAREYEAKYPTICKAIDKPNGGHGSAVNAGIKNATGKYFKVVDSDDWVDEKILIKIIAKLKELDAAGDSPDMFLSNFIYDKQGAFHKKTVSYKHIVPTNKMSTWNDVGYFSIGKYIIMHSVIYRTEVLHECKLELPEHCFYVDNIYVFNPLPYVKKFYYMDETLYHYFIGRNDQSVNEKVMIGRIDQQFRVTYLIGDKYKEYTDGLLRDKKQLRKYMYSYFEIMVAVTSILTILSKNIENDQKRLDLWKHIKETDPVTYKRMNRRLFGVWMNTDRKLKKRISVRIYKVAQKLFGFN